VDDGFHGQSSTVNGLFMETIGRYLMLGGIALFLLGGGLYLAAKFGIPLGRLPGDIRIERDGFSFYFPLASSILVSVVLTILLNMIFRLTKK
jgi:hypothetical protein